MIFRFLLLFFFFLIKRSFIGRIRQTKSSRGEERLEEDSLKCLLFIDGEHDLKKEREKKDKGMDKSHSRELA